jgi:hypothetical protein
MDGSVVRIEDLTPSGAALITAQPLGIGDQIALQLEIPRLEGGTGTVRAGFTVRSCRTQTDQSWRVGGTLEPATPEDGRVLIEHCHVLNPRARLADAGRLLVGTEIDHQPADSGRRVDRVADL